MAIEAHLVVIELGKLRHVIPRLVAKVLKVEPRSRLQVHWLGRDDGLVEDRVTYMILTEIIIIAAHKRRKMKPRIG
ncbi:hypothetical protein NL676_030785 [Syzygium grande]|nr:hypothetical protein NL676_030785 [Syzygium grande]